MGSVENGEPLTDADGVDQIIEQWRRERPDLEFAGMAIIGRVSRLERAARPLLDEVFGRHGLEGWEFDVLATLRRHGDGAALTAGQLLASTMITSGAMTHRLDRLEARELLVRRKSATDGRQVLVSLTAAGRSLVDATVTEHAANEADLVSGLSAAEQQQLVDLLRRLSASLQR